VGLGDESAVQKLVAAVIAEAGPSPENRRDVLHRHLARLTISQTEQHAWRNGRDIIGGAYEALFTGKQRRDAGQFFTPFWAGEVMAGWIFEEKVNLALDPGCGSGGLLIPASRHPRRRGAKLLGVDLDPLAVSMLEANARLRGMKGVEARLGNFLLDELPEAPSAIVCNPPYSRHHAVPAKEKLAIHDGFERRLGVRFNGLSALHVLFLIRAIELADDEARLAFITPSDWLDVNYGAKVKEFLLEHTHVEAIIFFEQGQLFFSGVMTTAAITFIRKGSVRGKTKILRLGKKLPAPAQVLKALAAKRSNRVELVQLTKEQKWRRPTVKRGEGTRLGDVARIRRGIATGCNEFFVISEARRRDRDIPLDQVRVCAASPRAFDGEVLDKATFDAMPDDQPRWVLACADPDEERADTPLGRYLRWGKKKMRPHRGYLASKRRPWYAPETRGACPILFTYFNRERPRFIRNTAGALPLNTFLIVEPKPGVDASELHAALTSEPVMKSLTGDARVYGGGLWKLEPSELTEIRLPDFPNS
jgi:adenine-specific DNA-methyltransferase